MLKFRGRNLLRSDFNQYGINKLYIIQNIDRKLALDDIASAKGMSMDDLIKEMVEFQSGTGQGLLLNHPQMRMIMTMIAVYIHAIRVCKILLSKKSRACKPDEIKKSSSSFRS